MAYANYTSMTLRASAATTATDTDGQDTQIALPESVTEFWVLVNKTAEANADNLLTVRIQSLVGSDWFDLSWYSTQSTATLTSAADAATVVTRTPNIVDATSSAGFSVLAHYADAPTNTIRDIWVASGTAVSHTFSVIAMFPLNRF